MKFEFSRAFQVCFEFSARFSNLFTSIPGCSLFWLFLFNGSSVFAQDKPIFSEETLFSTILNAFDCSEKPDGKHCYFSSTPTWSKNKTLYFSGYYTLVEEDCLVYHTCETLSELTGRRKISTFMCPIGTKFNTRSKSCEPWYAYNILYWPCLGKHIFFLEYAKHLSRNRKKNCLFQR